MQYEDSNIEIGNQNNTSGKSAKKQFIGIGSGLESNNITSTNRNRHTDAKENQNRMPNAIIIILLIVAVIIMVYFLALVGV